MNQKLLAVAVAGTFTVTPLTAFAQSAVTISGFFKASVENLSINNFGGTAGTGTPAPAGGRLSGLNSSEGRLADDTSRIVFNVVEDLGGGMEAIAQAEMRVNIVNPSSGIPPTSGNTWVGIRSKIWGSLRIGLQDLHYGARGSYLTDKGDLRADSISIIAFAGGGGQPIANTTRTPNTVFYDTPSWGRFTLRVAYSFSPANNGVSGVTGAAGTTGQGLAVPPATSADIGSNTRRGQAWNFNPNYANGPLILGYSYWNAKMDNPNGYPVGMAASMDQRSDRLYGSYKWGGFRIGLAWDRSTLTSAQTTAAPAVSGATLSNRKAWSLPLSYEWGAHEVHAHFSRANNDKAAGNGMIAAGADTHATMFAASYQYNLSKRTSLALNYAQINNGPQAAYNFYNSTSLGSADAGLKAGEDPRLWSVTMRHAF